MVARIDTRWGKIMSDGERKALWEIIGWGISQTDYFNEAIRTIDEAFEGTWNGSFMKRIENADSTPQGKSIAYDGFVDGWLDYREFVGRLDTQFRKIRKLLDKRFPDSDYS